MSDPGSISIWLESLQAGDELAAELLWRRFHQQLVRVAHDRIRHSRQRMADGEDVVIDAFDSFFRRVQEGRFPDLRDRNNLWSLLVTITERKALNLIRDQRREKRGGGRIHGDSVFFPNSPTVEAPCDLDHIPATPQAGPDAAMALAETLEHLLNTLGAEHQRIAIYKLEGRTNSEIASLLDCAVTTVERRLRLIRRNWIEEQE